MASNIIIVLIHIHPNEMDSILKMSTKLAIYYLNSTLKKGEKIYEDIIWVMKTLFE